MLGVNFWEERGFKPSSHGAYFKRSAITVAGTIATILLSSFVGSFIPIGLWFVGIQEYQRRHDAAWFGDTTFSRADHPILFVLSLGIGYLMGFSIIVYDLYRLGTTA